MKVESYLSTLPSFVENKKNFEKNKSAIKCTFFIF